ncbi:FHA domain-containing protein [Planctomicrobium sp. SH668]|uniref:FHA domain-containing protein n=1 Tax=Planctomicrobium sp. SH668 TaxID=3448126 RepID=UPI003F5B654A
MNVDAKQHLPLHKSLLAVIREKEQAKMLGELIPCGGGDSIPMLQPRLVVGRRSNCDIVLILPNISSAHCEFELIDGHWQIRDLGSRNGIKVNGERCESRFLHPGDIVSIAKSDYTIQYDPVGEMPANVEEDPFSMSLMEKAGLEKKAEPRRKPQMPPSVKKLPMNQEFDADEDAAMDWLMGDG